MSRNKWGFTGSEEMRGSRTKKRRPILLIILPITLALALATTYSVRGALDLLYFQGEAQDGAVFLEWATDTEVNQAGFYITRSDTENGSYSRKSSFIPALGSSATGFYYTYLDTTVTNGSVYWYQLEAVDVSNQSSFSEKIQVSVGSQTPTVTSGQTSPSTASVTPTQITSAASSTPTRIPTPLPPGFPTNTSTPFVALSPTPEIIQEPTQAISATATLIPLPEITLQFPTPPANSGDSVAGEAVVQKKSSEDESKTVLMTIGRNIFLGFIVLIWVVLAVWFYFSARRLE